MLRVTLHINAEQIGDYEVRNLGETFPGECRYSIRPILDGKTTGEPVGHVHHYVAQGAESLAAKVMLRLARGRTIRETS